MFGLGSKRYDQAAFAQLYRQHIAMVRFRAKSLLRNEQAAEDIAQEVFVQFLKYQQRGGTAQQVAAFLYKTATNLSLNHIRNHKRRAALLEQNKPSEPQSADPTEGTLFHAALSQSTEEEARIALYYYCDGMEHQEIADLMGLQRRTVGRRIEKFNDNARQLLDAAPKGKP